MNNIVFINILKNLNIGTVGLWLILDSIDYQ